MKLPKKNAKMIDKNSKDLNIITRPNATSGFWLCTLLPIAFLATIIRNPFTSQTFEYRMITITSWGLCLQSINFFLYLQFGGGRTLRIFYTLTPGFILATTYYILLRQNMFVCSFWGIITTLPYQFFYLKIMRALPKSFTFGEASIIVQGSILFLMTTILQIPHLIVHPPINSFDQMNAIMMEALFCLTLVFSLMYFVQIFRNTYLFYPLFLVAIVVICLFPVTSSFPIVTIFTFIFEDLKKVFLLIYYVGLIGLAISAVIWQINKTDKATTTVRKIFHLIMIFVFIPGVLYQCTLLYILTGIAFALLVLLEVLRVAEIYPFYESLQQSVSSFTDVKDSGLIAFTPLYLLIGCALPMWIHPMPCSNSDTTKSGIHLIIMLSGVISVGIGDTVASIIGSRIGSHKWWNSEKSVEGTLGSILFQCVFVVAFYYLKLIILTELQILIVTATIIIISLMEAFTDQVDNIVLPLCFYILVNLA